MDGGTFLVWKILIHYEIQVTSSNMFPLFNRWHTVVFSTKSCSWCNKDPVNHSVLTCFHHPNGRKMMISFIAWSSQPLTTAGMMEPAIDWASWRSPSHKTHLPKTCPKIRKKHMTSTWVSVSPFVEETFHGSTHQISQEKNLLEFSWDSHHQKTPNLRNSHHIEHRTHRDNLPMPQVSDFDESNVEKKGWIPRKYHGNSMKYLLVFRFTRGFWRAIS